MIFHPTDADTDPPTQYYFHGTKASFTAGDVVRPRSEHGGSPTTAPLVPGGERHEASDDYAYVTTRFYLAWAYAHMSGGHGEPVVLNVEPQGEMERDPEHGDHMDAYRCQSARVLIVDGKVAISVKVAEKGPKEPVDPNKLQTYLVKNVRSPEP